MQRWLNVLITCSLAYSLKAQTFSSLPISEPWITQGYATEPHDSLRGFWQKLINNPLVQIQDSDRWINISPYLNLTKYSSLSNDSLISYRNSRGFFLHGKLGKEIYWESFFSENQGFFPEYQRSFTLQNGIFPGQGRVKPFKKHGIDFAQAMGLIHFKLKPFWRVDLGNGKYFVGNGYRSSLISDAAFSYPLLCQTFSLHPHWSFSLLYASWQTLDRIPVKSTTEANFKRSAIHLSHINWTPHQKVRLTLFQASKLYSYDSIRGALNPPLWFFQPLPLIHSFINIKQPMYVFQGLDVQFILKNARLYAQIASYKLDDYAFQIGVSWSQSSAHWKTQGLLEYNHSTLYMYSTPTQNNSWIHYQQASAQLLGNGFQEGIFRGTLCYKNRLGIQLGVHYAQLLRDQSMLSSSLLSSLDNTLLKQGLLYGSLGAYVTLNTHYQMQLFADYQLRENNSLNQLDRWISFGLKTNLIREYFEF